MEATEDGDCDGAGDSSKLYMKEVLGSFKYSLGQVKHSLGSYSYANKKWYPFTATETV